jgi:hypothetical protein
MGRTIEAGETEMEEWKDVHKRNRSCFVRAKVAGESTHLILVGGFARDFRSY